jgi:hypothetical protein
MSDQAPMSFFVTRRVLLSLAAIGIAIGLGATDAPAITFRTVALSGQPAPGAPDGGVFANFFRSPVLNRNGQVAFTASSAGPSGEGVGIWSEGAGNLALIARRGMSAPGTDVNFSILLDPLISSGGQTAFPAVLSGPGVTVANRAGFWSDASGILQLVAREGSPAPNAADGTQFARIGSEAGLFNPIGLTLGIDDAGRPAFFAGLNGPSVDTSNDETIWSARTGSLNLVAREGSPAPAIAGNDDWGELGSPVFVNGIGQLAFAARIGPDWEGGTGSIWTELDGVFRQVASEGSAVPGTPAGTTFGSFIDLALNNAGDTAIIAEIGDGPDVSTTNDTGVWAERAGNLRLVIREGDAAPGVAGATFRPYYPDFLARRLVMNSHGDTAFFGAVDSPTATVTSGIWSEGGGDLHLVALKGLPAPGTDPGTNFNSFRPPVLNASGHVAFQADLQDGSTGVWVEGSNGLELVVRTRQQFEVAPGDIRTIEELDFSGGSGNEDGRRSGFNDFGQLVFRARFTDDTSGIFVAHLGAIPEPGSAVLVLTVICALCRRYRSRFIRRRLSG